MKMKVSLWGAHHQSEGPGPPGPAGERGLRMRSRGERESWESLKGRRPGESARAKAFKWRKTWGVRRRVASYLPATMLGALAHMRLPRGESD